MDAIDRDLMIRTVIGEAGNQGPAGMAAVAHVINNRATSGKYGGSTPGEVVMAPNQFEPWSTRSNELFGIAPSDPKYQAAAKIVDGVTGGQVPDPTNGATHFMNTDTVRDRNGGTLGNAASWAKNQTAQIGAHTFYAPDGPVSPNAVLGIGAPTGKFGLSGATATAPAATSPTAAGPTVLASLMKPKAVRAYTPNDPNGAAPQTGLEALIRTAAGQGTYTPPVVSKLQGLGGALSQLFGGSNQAGQGAPDQAGSAAPAMPATPAASAAPPQSPGSAPSPASQDPGDTSLPTGDAIPTPPPRPADLPTSTADAGSTGGFDLSSVLSGLFG